MSLQFILGNAGSGKSHFIYEKIIEESMAHPDKKYIVIVPDQFTMQTQIEMASRHPRGGLLNIDVVSFNRLAYRLMSETGSQMMPMLDDTGKTMVLKRVAQKKKKELGALASQMQRTGYIREVKSMVSEFMQYDISPDRLKEESDKLEKNPLLQSKLKDIGVLYQGFFDFIADHYVTTEEISDLLCRMIPEAESMKDSVVLLDEFTGFTPVQHRIITSLLTTCSKVYVTLTMESKDQHLEDKSMHRLFYLTKKTYRSMKKLAGDAHVMLEEPIRLEDRKEDRFSHAPELKFLEKHLFRYDRDTYKKVPEKIRVFEADTPAAEMEHVAAEIGRLVREKNWRYRDIAIITGDLETYGWEARRALLNAKIPVFLDSRRSVLVNPLVECVRAAFDILVTGFSYESMFRYLRSGLTELTQDEVDELENYCLALGIRGRKGWEERFYRCSQDMDPARVPALEDMRQLIMADLSVFADAIHEKNRTVRTCCEALYNLLMSLKAQEKIEAKKTAFEEKNEAALAKEYGQVYACVMDMLDKMVEILGDEEISLKDFRQMIEEGLAELKIGIIPPTSDQVLIGDVERTRQKNIKALFFVGVNDQVIPGSPSSGGILSEADRDTLLEMDMELAPSPREEIFIQKFYLYQQLTKPSEYLSVSYAVTTSGGSQTGPAYLIGTLRKLFTDLVIQHVHAARELKDIENRQDADEALLGALKDMKLGQTDKVSPELLAWFYTTEEGRKKLDRLCQAVFSKDEKDVIAESVARVLYGETLSNSVSRIERYAACAYAHFLQYGLRLAERETYSFGVMDMGNILHRLIEQFGKQTKQAGYSIVTVPEELENPLIASCLAEVMEDYGNQILKSSALNRHMITRAEKLLRRSIWAIREELKNSDFEPESFEMKFDSASFLESMRLSLTDNGRMDLKGKIDRVDIYEEDNRIYVRIVDYKTGSKKFSLEDFYYGLQLQLIIYMKAALELEKEKHPGKDSSPAALLYYQMKDPFVELSDEKDPDESRIGALKMNGLVSAEEHVFVHLDRDLEEKGTKSRMLPIARKKDGALSATSSVADEGQFYALTDYAMKTAEKIGREILAGHVEKNPYRKKDLTACDYCSYREVCGFDPRITGKGYRYLKEMKKDALWEAIEIGHLYPGHEE